MVAYFRRFAEWVSEKSGSPWTFLAALLVVAVWGVTGPLFHFSNSWQLVINTGTTIVTFLMVFLIQNTQNRETRSMQIKLNELIDTLAAPRDELVDIEDLPDEELQALQEQFREKRQALLEMRTKRTQTSLKVRKGRPKADTGGSHKTKPTRPRKSASRS